MTRTTLFSLASACLLTVGAASAQEVTLNMHQFLPAQAGIPGAILSVWADRVEEASGGRIQINEYPSMQLGGVPPELMDQVIDGVADIVWTVVGYTPGRFPRTEVFELPFMVSDEKAGSYAYWKMFERHMADTEFADVKMLATWVHGPGAIHSATPVNVPADMKGLKVRGASRMVNAMLAELGASPVGMPVPAVPEALSKGVVDAVTIPWEVTGSLKVAELVKNHTEFEGDMLYTLTFVLAMNKDRYESLPEDLKAVIDANSGLDFSVFSGGEMVGLDKVARDSIGAMADNKIVTIADSSEWRAVTASVYADWVAEMNDKGIDGQGLIDEARALMDEYLAAN